MKETDVINFYDDFNNLFLNFYLIGYESEGESILITITSTEPEKKIYYVAIIDSYETKNINVTTKLLENILDDYKQKDKKIDLLCWTHPHDDHSKGMLNILKKYCAQETLIVTPNLFYMPTNNFTNEVNEIISFIRNMSFNKRVPKRANLEILEGEDDLQIVNVGNAEDTYQMKVKNYGPYSNVAYMQNPDDIDLNKLSISLMLSINGFNIFLGGDTHNMNINSFRNFPEHINLLKIPHHTSPTAKDLAKRLNILDPTEIACTTIYNKLPEKELLKKYIDLSQEIFCTSNNLIDSVDFTDNNDKYQNDEEISFSEDKKHGVLKIALDIIKGEYIPHIGGNATSIKKCI